MVDKILIVEDDKELREYLKDLLLDNNFSVETTKDGTGAINFIKKINRYIQASSKWQNFFILQKSANIGINRGVFKPQLPAKLMYSIFTEMRQRL